MGDKIQSPFIQPSSTPPHHHPRTSKSNLSTLYYGLAVIGTTTIVFAIYYIIVLKWCFISRTSQSDEESTPNPSLHEVSTTSTTTRNFVSKDLLCSFKYNKEEKERSQDASSNDIYECAVCLSAFEDGEQVRKLPKCKHSFHAPCIDMWLYSHSDCPLCRTPVPVSTPCCGYHRHVINALEVEENARDVSVDSDSFVSV